MAPSLLKTLVKRSAGSGAEGVGVPMEPAGTAALPQIGEQLAANPGESGVPHYQLHAFSNHSRHLHQHVSTTEVADMGMFRLV